MRVRVQQEQKFLVTTERALWRYDNAFIFTNQSEVDFGITLVNKGNAKSEQVTARRFKNEFEMKEARHVKKQQSSQKNKTQSTKEKERKKNLRLEGELPTEAE